MNTNNNTGLTTAIDAVVRYLKETQLDCRDLEDWIEIKNAHQTHPDFTKFKYKKMDTVSREYISSHYVVPNETDRIAASKFFGYELLN